VLLSSLLTPPPPPALNLPEECDDASKQR